MTATIRQPKLLKQSDLAQGRTESESAILSAADWRRPSMRFGVGAAHAFLLAGLVVVGLGPLLWLA